MCQQAAHSPVRALLILVWKVGVRARAALSISQSDGAKNKDCMINSSHEPEE